MRTVLVLLILFLVLPVSAADFDRETRWADEILPAVLVGDPVWLTESDGHKFLSLYTPAEHHPRAAVILVHGSGVHPDWGFISTMRQKLPEADFATLSVQMPVLAAEATGDTYLPEFDRASQRLALAVDFLKGKGYQRIALVSHSLGCRMSYRYLSGHPDPTVKLWIPISISGHEDFSKISLPILDIHAENDLAEVLRNVPVHAKELKNKASTQIELAKTNHFYEGQEDFLIKVVAKFLDRQLP